MQKINEPTAENMSEFKEHCPIEINTRYLVKGYRLNILVKTCNILSIRAYPTRELRKKMSERGVAPININVEIYRKALIEVGLFHALENKIRKAESLGAAGSSTYKLAKELLLEVTQRTK
jgi:hypothetical protein